MNITSGYIDFAHRTRVRCQPFVNRYREIMEFLRRRQNYLRNSHALLTQKNAVYFVCSRADFYIFIYFRRIFYKKVHIKRQPNGCDGQLISLDKLHNVVGHTTGGYHTTYSHDIYFAFVDPDDALGAASSHRHDYSRSDIKVCVFPTGSEKGAFEAFCKQHNLLLSEHQHRLPPLGKEIRTVLQMAPNHSIRRYDL